MALSRDQYFFNQQLFSARVVSTSNLVGSYLNGPLNNGVGATLTSPNNSLLIIDSVTLNQDDRVLLVSQSSALQNGVYVVNSNNGSSPWVLTRSSDQQCIEQMKVGQYLSIDAGSVNKGSVYVLIEPLPSSLGISNINFSASSSSSQPLSSIKAGVITSLGGQGAGPLGVAVLGLTPSSVIVGDIANSSNVVAVADIISANNSFSVTFTGDPGANCSLNYIALIAPQ